jgi:hypothetical protein
MIWTTLLPALAAELLAAAADGAASGPAAPKTAPVWMSGYNPYLIVGGMVIILFFVVRMRRQQASRPVEMSGASSFKDQPKARGDAERLAVDLEETARAVSALLDTKIRVLDKLIRDADERIARLERLAGPAGPGGGAAQTAGAQPAPEPPEEPLAHHQHIFSLADQGLGVQEIAEKSGHPRGEVELVLSLRKLKRPGK